MSKPKTQRALKDNEAKAVLRMLRTSGQKLNLVAAMIRGKKVDKALAELVADHFFLDVHRHMLVAIVNAEGQTDELRQDRGATAPDLDDFITPAGAAGLCLLEQIAVDERALPE